LPDISIFRKHKFLRSDDEILGRKFVLNISCLHRNLKIHIDCGGQRCKMRYGIEQVNVYDFVTCFVNGPFTVQNQT